MKSEMHNIFLRPIRSEANPAMGMQTAAVKENNVMTKLLWNAVMCNFCCSCGRMGTSIALPRTRTNGTDTIATSVNGERAGDGIAENERDNESTP